MSLPIGTILIWHGSVATIPAGFVLCDGTNGTPDLRDKFVIGAGGSLAPGATGGTETHTHTVTTIGHFHTLPSGNSFAIGTDLQNKTTTVAPSGSADARSHIPPYMAFCYIMRV